MPTLPTTANGNLDRATRNRRLEVIIMKLDHREIGRKLDLFMFHELSPGSPIWLPKGTILYNILADGIRKYNASKGYEEVRTPILWKSELYRISGHMEHYQKNMFHVLMEQDEEW